jgi:carboxypeptidase C (cathepsin A)
MNTITSGGGNVNVYNFRDFGNYDFSNVDEFMNYQETCTRYNVDPSVCGSYVDENNNVYEALTTDFMQSVATKVAYLLENNLPVMLYNGQDDIICNSPNQQNWVGNLNWTHQNDFYNTEFQVWVYENQTMAGLMKQNSGLTFVIVNKAGHLSPMDQINTTTEMVRRFVAGDTNWTNPFSYFDL